MGRKRFAAPRLVEVASLMTLTQFASISGAAGDNEA